VRGVPLILSFSPKEKEEFATRSRFTLSLGEREGAAKREGEGTYNYADLNGIDLGGIA